MVDKIPEGITRKPHDATSGLFGYQPNKGLKLKGIYEWDVAEKKIWYKDPHINDHPLISLSTKM